MATEEDVMNETQNRTAADVVMQAVYEMSGDYLDVITVDMIAEGNYRNTLTWTTDHILAALAESGYVVVDRERFGRLRTAARIAVRYVLGDDVDLSREIAVDDLYVLPGDLDPLPTQEGE
jgi:hypothetical protein